MDTDLKLKFAWNSSTYSPIYRELEAASLIIPEVRSALCNQNFPRYRAARFRLHK